jgi:YD repeat-containing protein
MQLRTITAAFMLCALGGSAQAQQPTTFRDASGRLTGTAVNNGDGSTSFRDAAGRLTGTATRNGDGTTSFRDSSGRLTGTSNSNQRKER